MHVIVHFIAECLVAKPSNRSETKGDDTNLTAFQM